MNGIDKILQRLDDEAQGKIDAILAEAKQQAAELEAKANAEADRLGAELDARGSKDAEEREERLVSVAQMEARQKVLAAKQEMMEEAFAGALDKLCGAPDKEYAALCAGLLVKAAPDGKGEAVFAEDRQEAGRLAVEQANKMLGGGALKLSSVKRPIKGGFILLSGSVEVNCSFETLVRLQRSESAGEVAALLFPEA